MPILGIMASSVLKVTSSFESIASATGTGSSATITFSSIPATYTDLVILTSLRTNRASATRDVAKIQFNSNTGANYKEVELYGTGTAISTATASSQTSARCGYPTASTATASTFSSDSIYIPSYLSSTNKPFTVVSAAETNAVAADIVEIAGLWSQTAAITSIKIFPAFGTSFDQYSTAYLYGISNT